ncbi:pilus assembly protein TadG-related protein [Nonomuraea angiospora]|uniref:pilus assembly protein TadG-related protein n=1 Tax=Nonomuraea angiospora TaxID=46172 RepID=UPI0029A22235|nr:pilus assembly protein TadG-related protein [Nonomuraea angiospora]MDX3099989.1 pilus assembly protein TadG-related protein [Nonomuraea angiospora]
MAAQDPERGSITPYALIFITVLLLFIGLVVDVGNKLRAGWEAVGIAEETARAGAGQIDRAAAYRGDQLVVDRGAALRAAEAHLSSSGHRGSVAISGPASVRVTVTVTRKTWLLSLVGVSSVSMTAHADADLVAGVEGPNR